MKLIQCYFFKSHNNFNVSLSLKKNITVYSIKNGTGHKRNKQTLSKSLYSLAVLQTIKILLR